MRLRPAGLLIAALLVAAPAAAQTPELPTIHVGQPTVKVLSTGAGQKRPIRYTATRGARERMVMRMETSMTMDLPGAGPQSMDMPPMTLTMDADVTDVSASGDISMKLVMVGMEMNAPNLPPGMLDGVKGLTIEMVFNNRGVVNTMKIGDGPGSNPLVQQMLNSSGLDRMAIPMPEEPLGVGARFEVTNTLESGGMKIDQTSLFEIVALDETSVTIQTSLRQDAKPQTITMPDMPAGATANLVSMSSTGGGSMVLRAGSLIPTGTVDIANDMTMDVSAEGQSQRLRTGMKMKMTVSRQER